MPRRRSILLTILALLAVLAVAACEPGEAREAPGAYTVSAAEAVEMFESGERTIIDVRTRGEFDDAHVVGALNIDVEGPDFADRIAELDTDEPYVVYCRSGRRSATAAALMAEAGVADIADAGGLADFARAGAPVEASAPVE
jgi:phage shock protein E